MCNQNFTVQGDDGAAILQHMQPAVNACKKNSHIAKYQSYQFLKPKSFDNSVKICQRAVSEICKCHQFLKYFMLK